MVSRKFAVSSLVHYIIRIHSSLYANVDGFDYSDPDVEWSKRPEIDRWILSLLNSLVKDVDGYLRLTSRLVPDVLSLIS